jgi:hypothetical protein
VLFIAWLHRIAELEYSHPLLLFTFLWIILSLIQVFPQYAELYQSWKQRKTGGGGASSHP